MNKNVVINQEKWSAELSAKWAGKQLCCFEELESTNLTAVMLGDEGAAHGTLIVADKQTAGRGRRGRTWESPAGKNLYFSILLRPRLVPDQASMLTLVAANSVARAVESFLQKKNESAERRETCKTTIKWPNDILINGKKICGILTEMRLSRSEIKYVIIGVGINVKRQQFSEEIVNKASSLEEEAGQEISRETLLCCIMKCFEEDYEAFMEAGNLKPLLEEYHKKLLNKDAYVKVLDPKGEFEGISKGITQTGELIVERENGSLCHVYAGEVSVRGSSGYV